MKQLSIALVAVLSGAACSSPTSPTTLPAQSSVARPNSTASLGFKVYTAGTTPGFTTSASAVDIAPGPNGTMWFTDDGTPAIGRIAADGTFTEFTTGLPSGASPYAIAAGTDGNMWFSDLRGVVLGRVTPSGKITEFRLPGHTGAVAMSIAFVRGIPWIVGVGKPSQLAHLTSSGSVVAQTLPSQFTPSGSLAGDSQGNLFFNATNTQMQAQLVERPHNAGQLIRYPMHMHFADVGCCPNRAPRQMVIGPDGNPWFTTIYWGRKLGVNYLGTLRAGTVSLAPISEKGLSEVAYPSGIAAGANTLWLSGSHPVLPVGALWHVDLQGNQKVYALPYRPFGLAADGRGHPWFTSLIRGQPSQIVEVLSY
jgi:streptogramin lyase